QLATSAEAIALSNSTNAITPSTLASAIRGSGANATTTVRGTAEIATPAEIMTGTDNTRMVTPFGLADAQVIAQYHSQDTYGGGTFTAVPFNSATVLLNKGGFTTDANRSIIFPTTGLYLVQLYAIAQGTALTRLFMNYYMRDNDVRSYRTGSDPSWSTDHVEIDSTGGSAIFNVTSTTTLARSLQVELWCSIWGGGGTPTIQVTATIYRLGKHV